MPTSSRSSVGAGVGVFDDAVLGAEGFGDVDPVSAAARSPSLDWAPVPNSASSPATTATVPSRATSDGQTRSTRSRKVTGLGGYANAASRLGRRGEGSDRSPQNRPK